MLKHTNDQLVLHNTYGKLSMADLIVLTVDQFHV